MALATASARALVASCLLLTVIVASGCPAPSAGLQPSPAPRKKASPSPSAPASAVPPPFVGSPVGGALPSPDPSPSPAPSLAPSVVPSEEPSPEADVWTMGTLVGSAPGAVDGPAAGATLHGPNGIDADAAGALYVADAGNHRIRTIAPDGTVATLAGTTQGYTDGPAASALLNSPYGVAVAADGTLYVADTGNHCVRKIKDGQVSTLAGDGTAGLADGTGSAAKFKSPFSLALASNGDLWVADTGNLCLRRVTPAGEVTTLTGGVKGSVDGPFAIARFGAPNDVAVAPNGGLYVADSLNHNIRFVDFKLNIVRTLAGSGQAGFVNGTGVRAKFDSPSGLMVDKNGDVLVADTRNHAIRRITAEGVTSTLAGGEPGMVDGEVPLARLDLPTDLCLGKRGVFYISDTENDRIRSLND